MKTLLSVCLRTMVLGMALVIILGGSSFAQSPPNREYLPVQTYDRGPSPSVGGAQPMAYSRAEDARIIRELDRAETARQASPPRYDEAEHAYRFAILADPYDTRAYFGLGFIFAAQERYAEAVQAYRKAVEVEPNSPAAHFNLGLMYVRLSNKAETARQVKILRRMKSPLAAKLAHLTVH